MNRLLSFLMICFFASFHHLQAQHQTLLEAVKRNDLPFVKELVEKGANVNYRDENKASILMWAAYQSNLEMVQYLVEKGANSSLKGVIWFDDDKTSWFGNVTGIAAFNGDLQLLQYFIEEAHISPMDKGYDPINDADTGWSAFEFAVMQGNRDLLKFLSNFESPLIALIKNKKDPLFETEDEANVRNMLIGNMLYLQPTIIEQTDRQKRTALHWAAQNGHEGIVKLLLNAGMSLDTEDQDGYTPLHLASKMGHTETIKILIKSGSNIHAPNHIGQTPLISATFNKHLEAVKILYFLGANPKLKAIDGTIALDVATETRKDFLENPQPDYFLLLDLGKEEIVIDDLNSNIDNLKLQDEEGNSLLHKAASYGYINLCRILLDKGLNINQQRKNGSTPLMLAAFNNQVEIVHLLLLHDANTNISSPAGFSALHLAAQHGQLSLIEALVKKGAKVNSLATEHANTPLLIAAFYNRPEVVEFLLKEGADKNYINALGYNALHVAILGYNNLIFELNNKGLEPFTWVAEQDKINDIHLATVKILVNSGTDCTLKDSTNKTALDLSKEMGYEKSTLFLEELKQRPSGWKEEKDNKQNHHPVPKNNFKGAKVSIPLGHTETINAITISENGKYLLSGGADHFLVLWDLRTGLEVSRHNLAHNVTALGLSPDNKLFATATANLFNNVIIWDFTTNQPKAVSTLKGHGHYISKLLFSPDGTKIITASWDKTIKIWDVKKELLLSTLEGHQSEIYNIDISKDGNHIVSSSRDKTVKVWNMASGKLIRSFDEHRSSIFAVAFSPDGNEIASADASGRFIIQDTKSAQIKYDHLFEGIINNIQYSNNARFISLDLPGHIALLDAISKKKQQILRGHLSNINDIKFSTDDKLLYSAGSFIDPSIKVWDVESGRLLRDLRGATEIVTTELLDDHLLISATALARYPLKSNLKIWNMATGSAELLLEADSIHDYTTFALSKDKKMIAIGQSKQYFDKNGMLLNPTFSIEIRMLDNLNTIITLEGHQGIIRDLDFSPDGKYLVSSAGEIPFLLNEDWDLESFEKMLYIQQADTAIRLWDVTTGKLVQTFSGHQSAVLSVEFSPDSKLLVSGGMDKKTILWDVDSGKILKQITAGYPAVFINDGKQIATRGDISELKIWNIKNNLTTPISLSTKSFLNALVYSEKTNSLIAGMYSGEVILWDLSKKEVIQSWQEQSNRIHSITPVPKENRLLSSAFDGTIKLWDMAQPRSTATFIPIDRSDWLIYTPDLYYKSSKEANRKLGFTIGKNTYTFDQFDLQFNRPDIILERVGLANKSLISLHKKVYHKRLFSLGLKDGHFQSNFDVPQLSIETPVPLITNSRNLSIAFEANGGQTALHSFTATINDIPVESISLKEENGMLILYKGTFDLQLSNGINNISLKCRNINGIKSLASSFQVNYNNGGQLPNLYLLSIGASEHRDSSQNLKYAQKDAYDVIQLFEQKRENYDSIYTKILSNHTVTKAKLIQHKNWLRQSGLDDKVIIFYAGHGLRDKDANLYLSTYDTDFNNPSQKAIAYDILEHLLDSIPARQKLLLIDACYTGELEKENLQLEFFPDRKEENNLIFRSGGRGTLTRDSILGNTFDLMKATFVDLRQKTGVVVIAAAAGTKLAFEGAQWNNGVFTSCLKERLTNDRFNINNNKQVTVSELQQYLLETVPKMTGNKQHPVVRKEHINFDWVLW